MFLNPLQIALSSENEWDLTVKDECFAVLQNVFGFLCDLRYFARKTLNTGKLRKRNTVMFALRDAYIINRYDVCR